MKILLIGCGLTGGAIASNLLKLSNVQEINLYSRTMKSAKAVAFELKNPKVKILEKLDEISQFQYIIIALSGMSDSAREESIFKSKTTFEVRQDELKYNIGAIAGLVHYLKNIPKKTSIIVVTNPVDEITNYLRITLKHEKTYGFGLDLDARRYSKILGKPVLCIGTHGKAVPLINSPSDVDYSALYKKADTELMSYIRRNGIPHSAAGEAFAQFFSKFISEKKEILHVSYYIKKSFLGVKGISISLPFVVKGGNIVGIASLNINDIEKKRFNKLAKQLKKSVAHILLTHKRLMSYR
jgi:malate/lactate dehydrogenase